MRVGPGALRAAVEIGASPYPFLMTVAVNPGSFGWSGAYGTHFWVDPDEKVVGILMAIITSPDNHKNLQKYKDIARRLALDLARTTVRRAERRCVALAAAGGLPDSQVVPYLNRLADLLFVMARAADGGFRPVRE